MKLQYEIHVDLNCECVGEAVEVIVGEIGDTYSSAEIRRLAKPKSLIATDYDLG